MNIQDLIRSRCMQKDLQILSRVDFGNPYSYWCAQNCFVDFLSRSEVLAKDVVFQMLQLTQPNYKRARNYTPDCIPVKKQPKTNANQSTLEEAKVVVGIDFGTTFSGFAFSLKSEPENVYTFYEWPFSPKPYCKTQTSLWYVRSGESTGNCFELQDWGWLAEANYTKDLQAKNSYAKGGLNHSSHVSRASGGHFLTKFKLNLAETGSRFAPRSSGLPAGLSAEQVISDYLKQLSTVIMNELEKRDDQTLKKDIKWCLAVPSIWTDAAKQTMIDCAQMAGLVHGPRCRDSDASLHPIRLVLEAEASSVYCQQKLKDSYKFFKGSKFLVVDAGGGTVDLVVHEKVDDSGLKVKEVTCSTGDLCGGTFVDLAFMKYLGQKIDCFEKFSTKYPASVFTIKRRWEEIKCSFNGDDACEFSLELPPKLADAWETHEKSNGSWSVDSRYEDIAITNEDMKCIFDGQVNKILALIKDQLSQVREIDVMMIVGGFSNSYYLMKRIRDNFRFSVKRILNPTDPGSAVCQGAVAFGTQDAEIMLSRKSRRTYGMRMYREFQKGDPLSSIDYDKSGEVLCKDTFCVFTRIGDDVPVDHHVTHEFVPLNKGEKDIKFTMYSTDDPDPGFVTDKGVVKVGSWTYALPPKARKMKDRPAVEVTMYFGRTHIEVSAKPKNFVGRKTSLSSVLFERDLL